MTWEIIQGDCREVLRTLPAESVDAVIADPPYGDTSLKWDRQVAGWLPQVGRVLKPSGSLWCFGSMRFFMARAGDFADWHMAQDVVWEKHTGSGFDADRFRRVHEHAVHFYPADVPWASIFRSVQKVPGEPRPSARIKKGNGPAQRGSIGQRSYEYGTERLMRSVIPVRSCHGYAVHPTQKPVGILEPLVRYSCPPGGVVLDPFAGSGSTGIAARQAGCSFIGIENDPATAEIARRRLSSEEGR